ncbi:MAG TPA: GTPase Era [Candidatus Aminicenantes bacterium]|nr:GTPase Era [Candidatus Aminicenantes bacterium]HEB34923.1 GTPase Era [Candidatus Aminicenantes bacterium]
MKVGYVALIGRPNVGKSTLLNKMLGQKVAITSDKPQTTRISILGIKTTQKGQIIFVDNPGIHKPLHNLNKRMMSFVYSALETSNLINLLIDVTLKFGHGDEFVLETLKNISTPIFLLINKVDIVKKEKILLLIDKYKDLLNFKEIIPISALKGTNLDILEDLTYDNLPEAQKIFSDDEISDQSQRFLFSEIVREKVLSHVKQELPFVTAVYMDRLEDEIKDSSPNALSGNKKQVQYINATIFVEKETHRRIVIGKQGRLIKTIGTQARQELEQILGKRVYLDLWVKVKENWRDSPDVLDLIESQK